MLFWVTLGAVFVAAAYVTFSLFQATDASGGRSVHRRLDEIRSRGDDGRAKVEMVPMEEAGGPVGQGGALHGLVPRAAIKYAEERLLREGLAARLRTRLRKADLKLQVGEFLLLAVVGGGFVALIGYVVTGNVILGIACWLGGYNLALKYLDRRAAIRQKAIETQLPDALNIMASSLQSGYSLLQSMEVIAEEMPPPVATEFGRVVRETSVNISLEDALANLLERVASDDLDLVVTAILIQRQVGGNLAEVLQKISHTIRERGRILGELRTQTAQGRASGWVISLLPVVLLGLIYLIDTEYVLPLFTHPLGRLMLGVAAAMEVTGMLVIRKMVDLEV